MPDPIENPRSYWFGKPQNPEVAALNIDAWRGGYYKSELETMILSNSTHTTSVTASFIDNMHRAARIAQDTDFIYSRGVMFGISRAVASTELYGVPSIEIRSTDFDELKKLMAIETLAWKYFRGESVPPHSISAGGGVRTGTVSAIGPYAADHYRSLLQSNIVAVWTAFETLSRDLWEACLNARPKLGFVALGADSQPGDTVQDREQKRKIKYPLSVRMLEKWDYNLKNRMGTLLMKKWDFSKRDEACEAYIKVFGKKTKQEFEELFFNADLIYLSALRNSIVHRACLADQEFCAIMSNHKTFSHIKEGEPIPLDGAVCDGLSRACCESGIRLLKWVDAWLVGNPE